MKAKRFVFIIPLVAGVGVLCVAVRTWRASKASELWPKVEGQVANVSVLENWNGWGIRRKGSAIAPTVTYKYVVSDVRYESSRVLWGRTDSYGARTNYETGAEVVVSYDPKLPAQSVLEPSNLDGAEWQAVVGGFLVFASAFVALLEVFRRRKWMRKVEKDLHDTFYKKRGA